MTIQNLLRSEIAVQLIRDRLLSTPEVQALVGPRVFGGFSESPDAGTAEKPLITIVLASGGQSFYSGVLQAQPIEIWALSALSQSEALQVYDTVFATLNAESLAIDGGDHRGLMREMQRPEAGWFEAGSSWTAMGRWLFTLVRDTPA